MEASETTTLVLREEITREIVLLGLWREMGAPIGESDWDTLTFESSDLDIDPGRQHAARQDLDERLEVLLRLREEIRTITNAAVGDEVTLSIPPEEFRQRLYWQARAVEENAENLVAKAPPQLRQLAFRRYDEAKRLEGEIAPVEAVA